MGLFESLDDVAHAPPPDHVNGPDDLNRTEKQGHETVEDPLPISSGWALSNCKSELAFK